MTHSRDSATPSQKVVFNRYLLNSILEFADVHSYASTVQVNKFMQENANITVLAELKEFLNVDKCTAEEFIKKLKARNKPDEAGKTPLIHLVQKDSPWKSKYKSIANYQYKLMIMMIDLCGYDINHVDRSGKTVFDYALHLYDPNDQDPFLMINYLLNHPKLKIESSKKLFIVAGLVQKQAHMYAPAVADQNSINVLCFLIGKKFIDVNEIYTDYQGKKFTLLHLLGQQLHWIEYFLRNYQFSDEVLNLKFHYSISSPVQLVWDIGKEFLDHKPAPPLIPSPTNLVELFLMDNCVEEFLKKRDINLTGFVYYAYAVMQTHRGILLVFSSIKEKLAATKFDIPADEKAFLEQVLAEGKSAESKDSESATTFLKKPVLERFDFYYLQLAKKAYESGNKKEILALAETAVKYGHFDTFNFLSKLRDPEGQFLLDINYKECEGAYGSRVNFLRLAVKHRRWDLLVAIVTHPAISAITLNSDDKSYEPTILEEMIKCYAVQIPVEEGSTRTEIRINEKVKEAIQCYLKAGGQYVRWNQDVRSWFFIDLDEIFYTRLGSHSYNNLVINDHRRHPGVRELYRIMEPYQPRLCDCPVQVCHCVTQAFKNFASSVYSLFVSKPVSQVSGEKTVKLESKRP